MCPDAVVCLKTSRVAPRKRSSRRMFWELAPGGVIGKPVKTHCPKVMNAWKWRKYKMEKASRKPWIQYERSPRAMQLREHTLKKLLAIFVDDSAFGADSLLRQVFVHSKTIFSCALTLMDKIRGWGMKKDGERGRGPNLPHACGYTLKKLGQKDKHKALNRECT